VQKLRVQSNHPENRLYVGPSVSRLNAPEHESNLILELAHRPALQFVKQRIVPGPGT
jgi:hypothetical protein